MYRLRACSMTCKDILACAWVCLMVSSSVCRSKNASTLRRHSSRTSVRERLAILPFVVMLPVETPFAPGDAEAASVIARAVLASRGEVNVSRAVTIWCFGE